MAPKYLAVCEIESPEVLEIEPYTKARDIVEQENYSAN
jgi:hypothetical protein